MRRPEPLPSLAVDRDQHHRAAVALDEARGDDADHALVPALAGDDEHAVAVAPLGAAAPRSGRRRRAGSRPRPLALAVEPLELLGQRLAPRRAVGAAGRAPRPGWPRRPAALMRGAEAEAEVGRAQARAVDAGARHQRAQAGARRPRARRRRPAPHERAVLVDAAARRRRPSRARPGRELVELGERGRVAAVPARPERLGELEDDARAAQLGERVARDGRAQPRAGTSGSTSAGRWWSVTITSRPSSRARATASARRDAAVDRDQQPDAVGRQRARPSRRRRRSPRSKRLGRCQLDLGASCAQHLDGERGGADAVDVVVAVHARSAAGRDRAPRSASQAAAMSPSASGSCSGPSLLEERARGRGIGRGRGARAPRP